MEYEIYYLCNLLGVALVLGIVLFHFVDADPKKKVNDSHKKQEKLATH